jgi:hypothetical protein
MPALLARPASTTPVFNDDSGRRARVLTWLARAACLCFVLVVGAVAFTLLTRVPLPGLGGLLPQETGPVEPRTAPQHVADRDAHAARSSLSSTSARTTGTRTTPAQAGAHPRSAPATTSTAAGSATTAAPASSSNGQPGSQVGGQAGTPSGNANAHATTKTRNPQAAAKKPSLRVVKEPNEHAATGHGRATATDDSATPPGQSK